MWYYVDSPVWIDPTAKIDPQATVDAEARIGPRTVVLAGARIDDFATIGCDTVIGSARIAARAWVGDHVWISHGVTIGAGARISDRVQIGVGAKIGARAWVVHGPIAAGAIVAPRALIRRSAPVRGDIGDSSAYARQLREQAWRGHETMKITFPERPFKYCWQPGAIYCLIEFPRPPGDEERFSAKAVHEVIMRYQPDTEDSWVGYGQRYGDTEDDCTGVVTCWATTGADRLSPETIRKLAKELEPYFAGD